MNHKPKPPAKPAAAAAAQRIIRSSCRPQSLGPVQAGAVSIAMGEPDSGTPAAVVDAATAALNKGRLAAIMIALINPGDRVLIPEPTYSLYADYVEEGYEAWISPRDLQPLPRRAAMALL